MSGKSIAVKKVGDELANALQIRAALANENDPALILDMIEGSTELHEALCVVAEEVAEDEAMLSGIKAHIAQMDARKARIERSIEARQNIILMAMEKAGISTIKSPVATISVRAITPKVEISDESLIPSRFWKQPDPTLDKRAINDAVKAGEDVPGTARGNGGIALQIRRN